VADTQRTRTVLNHLESVRVDIERTVDKSETREHWRALVRGTLMHWLGEMFDAGKGHTTDLETANSVLQSQNDRLKQLNTELRLELEEAKRKLNGTPTNGR
jgi:hypothetical protein